MGKESIFKVDESEGKVLVNTEGGKQGAADKGPIEWSGEGNLKEALEAKRKGEVYKGTLNDTDGPRKRYMGDK